MIIRVACFLSAAAMSFGQLTREAAAEFAQESFAALAKTRVVKMKPEEHGFESFEVKAVKKTLRCITKLYGSAKPGERSLYISMHGGGGAPAEVNDRQWRNQVALYVPKEGYYVAPRAPTNTWNLWHEPHIDVLFVKLIEDFVATRGVDPDRIYLTGYSAGGDGVYQLAPRLADRFAAAAMMAGHPNDASPDGLRNLPFRIYMGGKDAAYKRNEVAAQWREKLEALRKKRGGYDHKVTIYPELGHWMDRRDTEAIPWMAGKTREAWPKKVVWGESDTRSKRFYWLGGITKGVIEANVNDQVITVNGVGGQELTLWLNDALIDLDQAFEVLIDGRRIWKGKVPRTRRAIRESLGQRLDPVQTATAVLRLRAGL